MPRSRRTTRTTQAPPEPSGYGAAPPRATQPLWAYGGYIPPEADFPLQKGQVVRWGTQDYEVSAIPRSRWTGAVKGVEVRPIEGGQLGAPVVVRPSAFMVPSIPATSRRGRPVVAGVPRFAIAGPPPQETAAAVAALPAPVEAATPAEIARAALPAPVAPVEVSEGRDMALHALARTLKGTDAARLRHARSLLVDVPDEGDWQDQMLAGLTVLRMEAGHGRPMGPELPSPGPPSPRIAALEAQFRVRPAGRFRPLGQQLTPLRNPGNPATYRGGLTHRAAAAVVAAAGARGLLVDSLGIAGGIEPDAARLTLSQAATAAGLPDTTAEEILAAASAGTRRSDAGRPRGMPPAPPVPAAAATFAPPLPAVPVAAAVSQVPVPTAPGFITPVPAAFFDNPTGKHRKRSTRVSRPARQRSTGRRRGNPSGTNPRVLLVAAGVLGVAVWAYISRRSAAGATQEVTC